MKLIFLLFGACFVAACSAETFDGFKVYRLKPFTQDQKNLLASLENEAESLDFWNGVNNAGLPVDVMVKPEEQTQFLAKMIQYGIPTEVMINNVQENINAESVSKLGRAGLTWTSYYTLEDIYAWLEELAAENPTVSIISAGKSYEGRDLKGVKVSFKEGNRGVLIEGGIHAREWIGPATVTYLLNEILTSTDPTFRKIAESFDWYLFPSNNPDGFTFTHTTNRMWRKTRTPYGSCFGADPNRNWGSHWGENGTSTSACSDTYGGPTVFSEVETANMANFIRTIGPSLDVLLSFHSYSQMLLIPYGHSTAPLDNYADVLKIGQAAIASLATKYGTKYQVGNIAETIYPCSGTSMDWVKQEFKTPIAFTYELRDTGANGFVLPANQIIPNCEEVMDSIVTIFTEAEKLGYFTLG